MVTHSNLQKTQCQNGLFLPSPIDKINMTLGQGQWPRFTERNGRNQCTPILEKSVGSSFKDVLYSMLGPDLLCLTVAVWNIVGWYFSAVWSNSCWIRALNVNFSIFCTLLYRTSLKWCLIYRLYLTTLTSVMLVYLVMIDPTHEKHTTGSELEWTIIFGLNFTKIYGGHNIFFCVWKNLFQTQKICSRHRKSMEDTCPPQKSVEDMCLP